MSDQNHIAEILQYPEQEFVEHLGLEYNHRILFSGRFGIGKTTFLKYFFEDGEYAEDYNAVHLFPVNYQVSDNKDIFEYIKYDIISHLLSVEEIEFVKEDVPATLTVPYLLAQRPADMLAPLLHFFGGAEKAYEKYQELIDEVYEQHKAVQKDEKKELLDFIEKTAQRPGSIYERDFYTELIVNLLQRWKGENGKQSVLVVDDLDRIDPQHAFRLFNVFAAHFDHRDGQKNKFGFDKVIFVCDAQNIRNIFAHNYGSEVDFSGYIDKFFSLGIHKFDNIRAIRNIVKKIIEETALLNNHPFDNARDSIKNVLEFLLIALFLSKAVNLRALIKLRNNESIPHRIGMVAMNNHEELGSQFLVVMVLDILSQVIGSPEALLEALKKSERAAHKHSILGRSYNLRLLLGDIIAFLDYSARVRDNNTPEELKYAVPEENVIVNYRQSAYRGGVVNVERVHVTNNEGIEVTDVHMPDIFAMYQKALQKMIDNGY